MNSSGITHAAGMVVFDLGLWPWSWPFLFFLPIYVVLSLWGGKLSDARTLRYVHWIFIAAIGVLLAKTLLAHLLCLVEKFFSNCYGALYADAAWFASNGHPLYTSPDSESRYSLPYGPDGYIFVAISQHLFGPSAFSSKLPVFFCWLGAHFFLYLTLRKRHPWTVALAITTLGMSMLHYLREFEFWPRADLFLLFFVSLSLWIVVQNFRWAWVWLGIIVGIAVDLKIHGFVYFFPVIALLLQERPRWKEVAAFIGLAVCVVFIPFLLFPQISLFNYISVLRMDGSHRFLFSLMGDVLGFLAIFFLTAFAPFIIYRTDAARMRSLLFKNGPFLLGLVLGSLIVGYPASLEGAGVHHLIPFTDLFLFLGASFWADIRYRPTAAPKFSRIGASLIFSQWTFIYLYAFLAHLVILTQFHSDDREAQNRNADLDQIIAKYADFVILNAPGSLTSVEHDTYRSHLVFNGMPVGIDSAAIIDFSEGRGPQVSLKGLVQQIQSQYHRQVMWISPHGEEPFSQVSYYALSPRVFPLSFVDDFHQQFKLIGRSTYFDVYQPVSVLTN